MAPEQARGKPVDRRADLWAMGVILFEMLAGKALYRGETVTDTIAHVITQPPDWTLLPASTPAGVRRLLRRCLEKDPRNRLQSAGDARIEIDELMSGAGGGSDSGSAGGVSPGLTDQASGQFPRRSAAMRWLPWGIAAALLAALVYTLWPKPVVLQPLVKLDVKVASGDELIVDRDNDGEIAILSPDGQRLVYLGSSPTMRRLYVKPLDRLDSQPIPGTEGGSQPFFSPDGKSIGFVANGDADAHPVERRDAGADRERRRDAGRDLGARQLGRVHGRDDDGAVTGVGFGWFAGRSHESDG